MGDNYIQVVDTADNVATVLREVEAGETVSIDVGSEEISVDMSEDIQFGHKLALHDLEAGETITKYGKSIGDATEAIPAGTWVHVHNVESNYGRGDLAAGQTEAEG